MMSDVQNHTDQTAPPAATRLGTTFRWRYLAYFVGVPFVLAIYAGLNNWEMQHVAGWTAAISFYLGHSLLPWWITCSMTFGTKLALARWKPPWIMLLLIGHTLACMIVAPYSNWFTGLYAARWPELDITLEVIPLLSLDFWMYWVRAGVIWIGINTLFDRLVGLPLYRYVLPRGYDQFETHTMGDNFDTGWNGNPPGFLERLPVALAPNEVLAIKAEQHYIRVYGPAKEYMVLYRFRDAVRELDEQLGMQVHRSYWVNAGAIESVQARAKDFLVRTTSHVEIPVSGPYQGMIRELARNKRLPLRG
jgi:hypothetical protein